MVTDNRVLFFTGIYQDGTPVHMWQCQRCKTEGGSTSDALTALHFRTHWKTQACTRALLALKEPTTWLEWK